jgi:hypothetical protein
VKRLGIGVIGAVIGYVVGGFGGGVLINALSSNQFDRSVESAMTGAFVTGPLGAIIGFVVGFIWSKRRP